MATIQNQQTVGDVRVAKVDTNPTAGTDLPRGSVALAADGTGLFYKFGVAATNWFKAAITGFSPAPVIYSAATVTQAATDSVVEFTGSGTYYTLLTTGFIEGKTLELTNASIGAVLVDSGVGNLIGNVFQPSRFVFLGPSESITIKQTAVDGRWRIVNNYKAPSRRTVVFDFNTNSDWPSSTAGGGSTVDPNQVGENDAPGMIMARAGSTNNARANITSKAAVIGRTNDASIRSLRYRFRLSGALSSAGVLLRGDKIGFTQTAAFLGNNEITLSYDFGGIGAVPGQAGTQTWWLVIRRAGVYTSVTNLGIPADVTNWHNLDFTFARIDGNMSLYVFYDGALAGVPILDPLATILPGNVGVAGQEMAFGVCAQKAGSLASSFTDIRLEWAQIDYILAQ